MKNFAEYSKLFFTRYNGGLLLFSFLVSVLFTSCTQLVYRGSVDDMFVNSIILNLNIPIWIEIFGVTISLLLTIWLIRLVVMVDRIKTINPKRKILTPIKYRIEIKILTVLIMALVSSLFGGFAVLFDMMKREYLYSLFLIIQISILITTSLNIAMRIGDYVEQITGNKHKSFAMIESISIYLQKKLLDDSNKSFKKDKNE